MASQVKKYRLERRQVMKSEKDHTSSGLRKDDLMYKSHDGKSRTIVSRKRHENALNNPKLQAWLDHVKSVYEDIKPLGKTYKDAMQLAAATYKRCVVSQEQGWLAGTATYYTGVDDVSGGYAGNCGFSDLSRNIAGIPGATYGPLFAAGSDQLYKGGANCGACYEIKCLENPVCTGKTIQVTITDYCPTQGNEQWCGADKHHFDLSGKAFSELVSTMAIGHFELQYRRVPCKKTGPPVVSIEGNPYWQSLRVLNLAGGGAYNAMLIRSPGGQYVPLKRDWGTSFVHNGQIQAPISSIMSTNKTSGYVDKAVGASKQAAGKVFSNRLESQGGAQREKGQAEIDAANARKQAEATGDKVAGTAKQVAGSVTNNTSLANEGRAERLSGKQKGARNEF
ncbi:alpha-expansin [Klebsormidium nitens]|uniref:Expansin n=1 Tax=Klebsormidium nitens TaxID=105231 RepID=A0A1Y1INP9_KLENI|nr:alpha-expansin [Klebsormidium nitens]|eukprot:GAQ91109.1 alpha-expansin [Klebsormidium nitens]